MIDSWEKLPNVQVQVLTELALDKVNKIDKIKSKLPPSVLWLDAAKGLKAIEV